jgi:hypothetical protein
VKKVSLDQLLLVASFLAIAYSPFYCIVFIVLVGKSIVQSLAEKKANEAISHELKAELLKVQLVSAQVEELQSSINNVRAAMSLGNRR